jgi:hypothetical protein
VKLIALTGLPRAGKDTFADRLVHSHGFMRVAFSDPLKEAAAILLDRPVAEMRGEKGFDREAVLPEWGFSTRWFLQVLGTESIRYQVRKDFWIVHMRNRLDRYERTGCNVVITDCRFANEVQLIGEYGGTVVCVARPGIVGSGHVSDKGVAADVIVQNDGNIAELWAKVDSFLPCVPCRG